MNYKLILFDLGGVVFNDGTNVFIKQLSNKYSFKKKRGRELLEEKTGTLYREAKINKEEFWKEIKQELKIKQSANILENWWVNSYRPNLLVKKLISYLRRKCQVYYLSDNIPERVEKLNKKYRFISWFDGGVFSYEVGLRKTHPEMYLEVLKKAKVKPQQTIFIDDKAKNLIVAQRIGINTLLYTSFKKLKSDLQKLEVM